MQFIHETSTPEEKETFFSNHSGSLCKYRFWEDEYHKRVLTDNELFYSRRKRFNDPYDCGLPFRQHPENLDPAVIKYMVEKTLLQQLPHLSRQSEQFQETCAESSANTAKPY